MECVSQCLDDDGVASGLLHRAMMVRAGGVKLGGHSDRCPGLERHDADLTVFSSFASCSACVRASKASKSASAALAFAAA